jgi:methyl-accepting chemotaxis protein
LSSQLTLAEGDVTETGQLKRALSDMNGSLHRIVSEVRSGTDAIAVSTGEIATGNMDLSRAPRRRPARWKRRRPRWKR